MLLKVSVVTGEEPALLQGLSAFGKQEVEKSRTVIQRNRDVARLSSSTLLAASSVEPR